MELSFVFDDRDNIVLARVFVESGALAGSIPRIVVVAGVDAEVSIETVATARQLFKGARVRLTIAVRACGAGLAGGAEITSLLCNLVVPNAPLGFAPRSLGIVLRSHAGGNLGGAAVTDVRTRNTARLAARLVRVGALGHGCTAKISTCVGAQNDPKRPWCKSKRSVWYNEIAQKTGDFCTSCKPCAACTDRDRETYTRTLKELSGSCDGFNGDFGVDSCYNYNPWNTACQCSRLYKNPCKDDVVTVVKDK
jgi:hypothetical protein